MDELSDEELVTQYLLAPASDRSRQLLDELFRRHRGRVIAWGYRLTGYRNLAPALSHDVFVKAYASLDQFRRASRFTTWLYAIARNRCRDDQRARAARPREEPEDALLEEPSEMNEALALLESRDARHVLRSLMDDVLDETEKRVMMLHYGQDMRLDAITAALGLTNTSGAKAYIVSARRKLNAAVKRWNVKS